MNNYENPNNIQVVTSADDEKGKKKKHMEIIIIAVVLILVAAIAVTAVVIRSKNKNKDDAVSGQTTAAEQSGDNDSESENILVPMSAADDIDVTFEHATRDFLDDFQTHQETTTSVIATKEETVPVTSAVASTTEKKPQVTTTEYYETTTVKTDTPAGKNEKVLSLIQAFFDCRFYMDGTMMAEGSKTPIEMAIDGKDMHVYSELDGMDVAILNLDGKLYLMNPDKKTYAVVDAAWQKMMGIDENSMSFDFTKIKFDSKSPASVTKVKYEGKDGVCYVYENSDNRIEFVAVNNEIVQIVQFDGASTVKTIISLDEFTDKIPSDMLTVKGYSKKNMISFVTEMM